MTRQQVSGSSPMRNALMDCPRCSGQGDVVQRFYTCPTCGEEHTVTDAATRKGTSARSKADDEMKQMLRTLRPWYGRLAVWLSNMFENVVVPMLYILLIFAWILLNLLDS